MSAAMAPIPCKHESFISDLHLILPSEPPQDWHFQERIVSFSGGHFPGLYLL